MKPQTQLRDAFELEREVEQIAPVVRQVFSCLSGPREHVLRAIHDEAVSSVFAQRGHQIPRFRIVAAAALLALLMGGAIQYHFSRQAGLHARTLRLVLHIGAPNAATVSADGTTELANQLLNIQGLDEDTFFSPGGTEVLSL